MDDPNRQFVTAAAQSGGARLAGDAIELRELLKEQAHLQVRMFKVNTAISLVRQRETADEEVRAFRRAEGV
jgi:hypothetical protein